MSPAVSSSERRCASIAACSRLSVSDILPRSVHQRRNAGRVDGKNHRASRDLQVGHPVERVRRTSALRRSAGGLSY